jgi:hypothetical protein
VYGTAVIALCRIFLKASEMTTDEQFFLQEPFLSLR